MSLDPNIVQALRPGPPADPAHLVAVHVASDRLGAATGPNRPEARLHTALRDHAPANGAPARILVRGEPGAGKTSLIMRAGAEAPAAGPVDILWLRCGEDPDRLKSTAAFVELLVTTIRGQGAFVDSDALVAAAASQTARTPASSTVSVGLAVAPVTTRYDWKAASETLTVPTSPEERRELLVDHLDLASKAATLLVIVDDTDKFASADADGAIEVDSIANLFLNGVGFLMERPIALVVAVHPRYDEVPQFAEIAARGGFVTVDAPVLPADTEHLALEAVLRRRLEHAGLHDLAVSDLYSGQALAALQATYFLQGNHDLRTLLRRCQGAAARALEVGADRVDHTHVQHVLDQRRS